LIYPFEITGPPWRTTYAGGNGPKIRH
jgi:hypothetical protein